MTLFSPDNLCRPRADFAPSSTPLASLVLAVLRERFNVKASSVLASDEHNGVTDCFRVANVFVKTSRLPDALARFQHEADCSIRLHRAGAPVPRVLGNAFAEDGRAFLAFPFLDGEHFTGKGEQLGAAATTFGDLTRLARDVLPSTRPDPSPPLDAVLEELGALVCRGTEDDRTRAILTENGEAILRSMVRVREHASALAEQQQPVHVDYHPRNLLFVGDELRAVLDFEDLLVYPVAMASGFAAYKLIRRAAVTANGIPDARLVDVWCDATGLTGDRRSLGLGAHARVLTLLRLVLKTLFDGDDRFLFDLGKQARALREIDVLFDGGG